MSNIKTVIAKNITELRQKEGMTQLELSEKLNYSDKAVSKWERGESMPDISVLVDLADLFGVNLDYLISEDHNSPEPKKERKYTYNRGIITSVSILLVWFIAVLIFVIITSVTGRAGYAWLAFVYALPVSSVVWLVLNSIWFNKKINYLIISILMWSFLLALHLSVLPAGFNIWLIYFTGIPAQVIIILWSVMKKRSLS